MRVPTNAVLAFKQHFGTALTSGEKTVTIRLGDRSGYYRKDQIVSVLLESAEGEARQLGDAIIEQVDVCTIGDVSPREIEREGLGLRTSQDLLGLLASVYSRPLTVDTLVTLVGFRLLNHE
jgi:hypothetical protein